MKNLFMIMVALLLVLISGCSEEKAKSCGNGIVDTGEECDPNALLQEQCNDVGFYGGNLSCNEDCTYNTSGCSGSCGDGIIDVTDGEECDSGISEEVNCESIGYYRGNLSCNSECRFDISECERCGDGVVNEDDGEECEPETGVSMTCEDFSYYGGNLSCSDECKMDFSSCDEYGYCGDNVLQGDYEECDTVPVNTECRIEGHHDGELECDSGCSVNSDSCIDIIQVATGMTHTCILTNMGDVYCFGENNHGELGNLSAGTFSIVPVMANLPQPAIKISTGISYTCAVLNDHSVYCWGWNYAGQLGNGNTEDAHEPVQTSLVAAAENIDCGSSHTCALLSSGQISCWGSNYSGELGKGDTGNTSSTPTLVTGINNGIIVKNGSGFSCAVRSDNTLWCWGSNSDEQLGNGQSEGSNVPVQVSNGEVYLSNVTDVDCGERHACAIYSNNVACWGDGTDYKLGNGTEDDESFANPVSDIENPSKVVCGTSSTFVKSSDGKFYVWGSNYMGQLGLGIIQNYSILPSELTSISGITGFDSGTDHTCAFISSGMGYCWGNNSQGQLGTGNQITESAPTPIIP
ncbi:MAG: hypothetical protein JXR95_15155 [Deltaproteobacteria bacterium]|nr:hypothetical protein [Deltaproteobacteria bacterium]